MQAQFFRMVGPQNVAVSLLFGNQSNHLPDVPKRLVERLSLAIATFEERTLYHVKSVLIFLDENGHLCVAALPTGRHYYLSHVQNATASRGQKSNQCPRAA